VSFYHQTGIRIRNVQYITNLFKIYRAYLSFDVRPYEMTSEVRVSALVSERHLLQAQESNSYQSNSRDNLTPHDGIGIGLFVVKFIRLKTLYISKSTYLLKFYARQDVCRFRKASNHQRSPGPAQ
jgi:hypothetical protein